MLGRIVPGRLPSTVADIKLIDQRIAFNKQQLALLPQRVAQGLLSQHNAAYRRLYLEGEIEQLTQAKRNRRYATPSYRTPLDVFESTRRGGAAKKYVSESQNDGLPPGYFGDDNGSNGGSIPSDWNANDPVDFDVPEVPSPAPKPVVTWPEGWPGNHSPQITQLLVGMGKVGNAQLYDPTKSLRIHPGADLVHPGVRASFVQILARYKQFKQTVDSNPSFTTTDKLLLSKIITNMSQQIQDGEAKEERARVEKQNRTNNQSDSQSDTNSGDESIPVDKQGTRELLMYIDQEQSRLRMLYGREGERTKKAFNHLREVVKKALLTKENWLSVPMVQSAIKVNIKRGLAFDLKIQNPDPFGLDRAAADAQKKAEQEAAAEAARKAEEERKANLVSYEMRGENVMIVYVGDPKKMLFNFNVSAKMPPGTWPPSLNKQVWEVNVNYAAGGKRRFNYGKAPAKFKVQPTKHLMLQIANEQLAKLDKPATLRGLQGIKGFRKTGNLMGLGAMQAHDRNSHLANDGGMTPYERKSYLQAEREMALAKKRAGSKINLTKQLREEPITRPWQMQVSLSTAALNAISTQLDQQLASINLSQEMFTQQMHTHVAAVINSMPSGMGPSEQAEMIIEQVMAKVTNSSGLLKKDVKVDINRGSTSPLTFNQAESLSGVVGSLSGTRAALGRLLR